MRLNHPAQHIASAAVRCSSLTAGSLLAVFLVGATPANAGIVWSGDINQVLTRDPSGTSSYTMAITVGADTFSWEINLQTEGPSGTSALFTPMSQHTGVAASLSAPLTATRFGFQNGIGPDDYFTMYPTTGTSNSGLLLQNYHHHTGNFPGMSGAPMYAGFIFGDPTDRYFGWVGLTMDGPDRLVVNSYAYNDDSIGAGMIIPGPGAVALLGLAGVAGKRRRR